MKWNKKKGNAFGIGCVVYCISSRSAQRVRWAISLVKQEVCFPKHFFANVLVAEAVLYTFCRFIFTCFARCCTHLFHEKKNVETNLFRQKVLDVHVYHAINRICMTGGCVWTDFSVARLPGSPPKNTKSWEASLVAGASGYTVCVHFTDLATCHLSRLFDSIETEET